MTALAPHRNAYAEPGSPARDARGIEYDAFVRVTKDIAHAEESGNFPALAAALDANRRLWVLLRRDLMQEGNALPISLRARLIGLADFTAQHSARVLRRTAEVGALIEINTAVMRGLRGDAGI
ncbi:flagellar biosynthesis regulator FlaF [Falsirhodobacter algicola]|uniref:Flagellar biosynthesis regulator FlaF n=1 Tax=Falsirhodobacter algicola TaxID=2692330 RepID=A0A8J8SL21_9RHOB|nr:flagellar biosynthesis regulator FlaF [Falsirhodobacter algicola]QUS35939.1 flagellar biosynthesis regulator FlaF [Falsirhodobacter algicola]